MRPKHLIIDGRNTVYRAVYAAKADGIESFKFPAIILRFIASYIAEFNPTSLNICWDSKNLWRSKIFSEYKGNREYDPEISRIINESEAAVREVLNRLPVRQFKRDKMEADDLIYTICKVIHPKSSVVISSDGDLMQLPFNFNSVSVFDPIKRKIKDAPDQDPSVVKALMGDKSDNIDGYRGIGKVRSHQLASDRQKRYEVIESRGEEMFKRNLALIDLSLCPYMLRNIMYVLSVMAESVIPWDEANFRKFVMDNKMPGFITEIDKIRRFAMLK